MRQLCKSGLRLSGSLSPGVVRAEGRVEAGGERRCLNRERKDGWLFRPRVSLFSSLFSL